MPQTEGGVTLIKACFIREYRQASQILGLVDVVFSGLRCLLVASLIGYMIHKEVCQFENNMHESLIE